MLKVFPHMQRTLQAMQVVKEHMQLENTLMQKEEIQQHLVEILILKAILQMHA